MRGIKLTIAIITIIENAIAVLASIGAIILGGLIMGGGRFTSRLLDLIYQAGQPWSTNEFDIINEMFTTMATLIGVLLIIGGIFAVGMSIVMIILGAKFTSRTKPQKGIAITLLVFASLGMLGVLGSLPGMLMMGPFGIISLLGFAPTIVVFVFLIIYLVKLNQQNQIPTYPNTPYPGGGYYQPQHPVPPPQQ